jgi:hypothetical protein
MASRSGLGIGAVLLLLVCSPWTRADKISLNGRSRGEDWLLKADQFHVNLPHRGNVHWGDRR